MRTRTAIALTALLVAVAALAIDRGPRARDGSRAPTAHDRVRAHAAAPASTRARPSPPAPGVGDLDALDVVVPAGPTLAGVVHAADGTALVGISIAVRASTADADADAARWQRAAITGTDGGFAIAGLSAGTYELQADVPRRRTPVVVTGIVVPERGQTAVDVLVREARGLVTGRVIDLAGRPVADVEVGVTDRVGAWGYGATTEDDGTFSCAHVDEGPAWVRVLRGNASELRRGPGLLPGQLATEVAAVAITADDAATVTLVVPPAYGRISGVVLDELGRPVRDVRVAARREPDRPGGPPPLPSLRWHRAPHVTTDEDGRFGLEQLEPGRYTVGAEDGEYGTASAAGVALGAGVALTLSAAPSP